MIQANVTKFGQNVIIPQIFFGWYAYVSQGLDLFRYGNPNILYTPYYYFVHKGKSTAEALVRAVVSVGEEALRTKTKQFEQQFFWKSPDYTEL